MTRCVYLDVKIIRILHKCEALIEKSVPRVSVWHHSAPLSDAKLRSEGQICRSVPHTNAYLWVQTFELNQIYLEIFRIHVSHFDFDVIL